MVTRNIARAITAIPPTDPPAIAPMFLDDSVTGGVGDGVGLITSCNEREGAMINQCSRR